MAFDRKVLSRFRQVGFLILICLCFLLVQNRYAFGQVDEGSISGTIQDTSGAVVAGAQVTLVNIEQGITLQTRAGNSGEYSFSPVRIGHYTVSATAKGFSKTNQENLVVTVGQHLLVNIQLKPGAATETVEVTTAPPLLQTEEASVGQVITQESVNSLPLNGRNFTFLAQLGAGMQTPQADTRGNAASGAFSANGLRPAQNNYLLDGIDNNSNAVDFLNGTNFVILPPLDAIQEFKVQTADFSAELGRSAGAVLNATIKSGTNSLHGAAWEFFRNDKLDAADYFEDNTGAKKGELRMNQFGASAGGPIFKNKLFFFGDYEGLRRVQGTNQIGTVPTALERSSVFTNLSDILAQQGGNNTCVESTTDTSNNCRQDVLKRTIQKGVILDPATTRFVAAGAVDTVTGLTNTSGADGYVRDPFGCAAGTLTIDLANCPGLNQFTGANAARLDPNAIKLLNLYPAPNSGTDQYSNSPSLFEHRNAFDMRFDFNPSEKDQVFFRFSYADDPQFIPGIFGGEADGGAFQQGLQTAKSDQAVAGYTHVFTSNTINQVRGGFAHLHTTRFGPEGNVTGIPEKYGIQGIPTANENGGLPALNIAGLNTLGSNDYLPSDEVSQTLQVTDDLTKIYGKHSFKAGIEVQRVKFQTLQPASSHGEFHWHGLYTDIPGAYGTAASKNNTTTGGMAQMLLPAQASTVTGGYDYSGGLDQFWMSNIGKTYDQKTYTALYLQDDWKITPKLTINLGLRWDYFGPIDETNGGQANFVPSYFGAPTMLLPASGKDNRTVSTGTPTTKGTCANPGCWGFEELLNHDGIALARTNEYGQGLLQTQKNNYAPRVGAAYQFNPKLVVRGGFGLFFNAFENQGYGPNIGENYPFQFSFTELPQGASKTDPSIQVAPISFGTPFAGCSTAGPGGTSSLESGASCIQFDPKFSDARGLNLQGLQFKYQTPRTYSANLTLQYSLTRTLSAQASYVFTDGQDLQTGMGANNVTAILPAGASTTDTGNPGAGGTVPFPDFASNSSYQATIGNSRYHGLQTKLEQQFSSGFTYLLAYTYSKTMSDAGDLLNGGNNGGYRAPAVPGLGPKFDWGTADFDIRQVLHFSGGYELPFGKDKRFLNQGGVTNAVLGGWAFNWIATLQGGQPINFTCPTPTTSGTNCNVIRVAGQSQKLGVKLTKIAGDPTPRPVWIGNPAAFNQPCELGLDGPIADSPKGCIAMQGSAALGSSYGGESVTPGFHRLDYSLFKNFKINERFSMQFRSEFFNILNHPNFNAPNFGGNGVVSISGSGNITDSHFGEIGSTRDAPYDPRQIQFALKLYY